MKVALFGTCNSSQWRNDLIPLLQIEYFNPVVEDWTPECQEREIQERASADFILYALTPRMIGLFSIAELIDDSNKQPQKTLFIILKDKDDDGFAIDFIRPVKKSLDAIAKLAVSNGARHFNSLEDVASYLNNQG